MRLKAKISSNNVYYVKLNGQARDDRVPAKEINHLSMDGNAGSKVNASNDRMGTAGLNR